MFHRPVMLHSQENVTTEVGLGFERTAVPGGWIYTNQLGNVFVGDTSIQIYTKEESFLHAKSQWEAVYCRKPVEE